MEVVQKERNRSGPNWRNYWKKDERIKKKGGSRSPTLKKEKKPKFDRGERREKEAPMLRRKKNKRSRRK